MFLKNGRIDINLFAMNAGENFVFVLTKLERLIKVFLYYITPFSFDLLIDKEFKSLKRKMNLYFALFPLKKKKFINEINFINEQANERCIYSFIMPYSFVFEYNSNQIGVYKDDEKGLYFVIHHGKRLYYSNDFQSELEVKESYNNISIEQDDNSPHRYINSTFNVEENDVVIDVGAAEGNFSLEVVERVSALYIIEPDNKWIKALNATFEPWKDKVHIINKSISNIDNDKCITLNTLLGDNSVNFIKMDVEGAEVLILENSKNILKNNSTLKLAICSYHNKNDAAKIEEIMVGNKFNFSTSSGYILFIGSRLSPPYFRKGLIRAKKIKVKQTLAARFV